MRPNEEPQRNTARPETPVRAAIREFFAAVDEAIRAAEVAGAARRRLDEMVESGDESSDVTMWAAGDGAEEAEDC